MTPDRWKDVERLYHAARAEAPEARPAFLAKACGGDEELQQELQSLLAHASAAGVLDLVHDRVSERTNDPTRTGIEGPRLTRALAAIRTSAEAFVRPAIAEGSVLAGRYQVERRLGQGDLAHATHTNLRGDLVDADSSAGREGQTAESIAVAVAWADE
jgi:hypothetical protein